MDCLNRRSRGAECEEPDHERGEHRNSNEAAAWIEHPGDSGIAPWFNCSRRPPRRTMAFEAWSTSMAAVAAARSAPAHRDMDMIARPSWSPRPNARCTRAVLAAKRRAACSYSAAASAGAASASSFRRSSPGFAPRRLGCLVPPPATARLLRSDPRARAIRRARALRPPGRRPGCARERSRRPS